MNYELAKQLKDAGFPQTMKEGDPFFLRGDCMCGANFVGCDADYEQHLNVDCPVYAAARDALQALQ